MIARIRFIWRDALSLLYAIGDKRTPSQAKWIAGVALVYAVSPVDFLPDLTPFLGWGDDVVVVPTLLALAARTLPGSVLLDARARSAKLQRRLPWLVPTLGALLLMGVGLLIWGLVRLVQG